MTTTFQPGAAPAVPGAPADERAQRAKAEREAARIRAEADLQREMKRVIFQRRAFYGVVLLVALVGQVTGAMQRLHVPLLFALPAVFALELGGVVIMNIADVRRRMNERAVLVRLLSAGIALGATTFNLVAHTDHLLGGFFAFMSLLGYLVYLLACEHDRRDRLRATGALPPTPPVYELVGHWLSHPWITRRARALAKERDLGLYASIDLAWEQVRQEKREAAIAKVLRRKIRKGVDRNTADIALAVYDLDQIASRLAGSADYDGLTALLAADLVPANIASGTKDHKAIRVDAITDVVPAIDAVPAEPTVESVPASRATDDRYPERGTGTATATPDTGTYVESPVPAAGTSQALVPVRRPRATGTSRRPRALPAGTSTGTERGAVKAAARAHWDAEVAAGRTPTGIDLARAAGKTGDTTGVFRRWARDWSTELVASTSGGACDVA